MEWLVAIAAALPGLFVLVAFGVNAWAAWRGWPPIPSLLAKRGAGWF